MLTVQEAAERVRLTQWAIYRAFKRGELTAYKRGWRHLGGDITTWPPTPPADVGRSPSRAYPPLLACSERASHAEALAVIDGRDGGEQPEFLAACPEQVVAEPARR